MSRCPRSSSPLLVAVIAACLASPPTFAPQAAADDSPADEPYFSTRAPGPATLLAVGGDGTIFLAGDAEAADLPASLPSPEIPQGGGVFFVSAHERDGTARWTAYVAHPKAAYAPNEVTALAAAPDGSVWLGGMGSLVASSNALQPAAGDTTDGWFAKFTPAGDVAFASHLGGESFDGISGIAVDTDGSALVVGSTASLDFAGTHRTSGSTEMFVARVRADGAALDWSRLVHGTLGRAVAIAADGTIVAAGRSASGEGRTSEFPFANVPRAPRKWNRRRDYSEGSVGRVLRLDPTGQVILGGASLPFLGDPSATDSARGAGLVVLPDGRVLVGMGQAVARLSPDLTRVDAASRMRRNGVISRITAAPDGRVLVRWEDLRESPSKFREGLYLLEPDLRFVRTVAQLGGLFDDAALDGHGTLHALVSEPGLPFDEPVPPSGGSSVFVTKIPLDAPRTARVDARPAGVDAIELTWVDHGSAVASYEIERLESRDGLPWSYLDLAIPVATLPADARSYRAEGLQPGRTHTFRVVAVLSSGIRTALDAPPAATAAVNPGSITAVSGAGQTITIEWDVTTNGAATAYELERRLGDGAWTRLGDQAGRGSRCPHFASDAGRRSRRASSSAVAPPFADFVPDTGEPVGYRVRAVGSGGPTDWIVSEPVVSQPTLHVTQRSGRVRGSVCGDVTVTIAGTLEAMVGSAPLAFDPASQDLRVVFGDAAAPEAFVVPAGDPAWTRSGPTLSWIGVRRQSDFGLRRWTGSVVIDLQRGTFRIRAALDVGAVSRLSDALAVNFEFGELRGGDLRTWRRSGGPAPSLDLR